MTIPMMALIYSGLTAVFLILFVFGMDDDELGSGINSAVIAALLWPLTIFVIVCVLISRILRALFDNYKLKMQEKIDGKSSK